MSDLISRSALKEEMVKDLAASIYMSEMRKTDIAIRVLNRIDEAPAVDAVPVVRCRECAYAWKAKRTGTLYCELHESYAFAVRPDGYCSRGAKMRGDADAE